MITRHLARASAAALAACCLAAWVVIVAAGAAGAWLAGVPPEVLAAPAAWRDLGCVALPVALQVGVPLALGQVVLRWHEDGELLAAESAGVSRAATAAAAWLPVAPLLLVLLVAVDTARPAARKRLADAAVAAAGPERDGARGLAALGAGTVERDGAWRALGSVAGGWLALVLDGAPAGSPGRVALPAGRVSWLPAGAPAAACGTLGGAELAVRDGARALADHGPAELTSGTIRARGGEWLRARWRSAPRARAALGHERSRRAAEVPALAVAAAALAALLFCRRPPAAGAVGAAVVLAVAAAALGPGVWAS